ALPIWREGRSAHPRLHCRRPGRGMIRFREARREDVQAVVALLAYDALGAAREGSDLAPYLAAFDAMQAEAGNTLIVGEEVGRIVATYQLTVISGLSLRASRRAQVESVREIGRAHV